jgi:regulatory protein
MSKYPPFETREKIKHWCALQERAHSDVIRKLRSWSVSEADAEQILTELISENFVSEERFARAFASGKFKIKKWGWHKIKNTLKQKGVSDYSIQLAKDEIDDEEYRETMIEVLKKKWPQIKANSTWEAKQKLLRYAAGKGYNPEEVIGAINNDLSALIK